FAESPELSLFHSNQQEIIKIIERYKEKCNKDMKAILQKHKNPLMHDFLIVVKNAHQQMLGEIDNDEIYSSYCEASIERYMMPFTQFFDLAKGRLKSFDRKDPDYFQLPD